MMFICIISVFALCITITATIFQTKLRKEIKNYEENLDIQLNKVDKVKKLKVVNTICMGLQILPYIVIIISTVILSNKK